MLFYYFLHIFPSEFTDFEVFSVFRVVRRLLGSPIQELEPDATPYRGGRCAACYPLEPQATKQKYLDYDYAFPPKESNLRKGPCRARDGVFS